jgi:thiol-disulfide isomerase/thioredoxin
MTIPTTISPFEFEQKIQQKKSFVLNVVANWCSDCTAQNDNIAAFSNLLAEDKLPVFQLVAQQEKGVFVDIDHLMLIESLGGHGYPRTVLIVKGNVISTNNVEIVSEQALMLLANDFRQLL